MTASRAVRLPAAVLAVLLALGLGGCRGGDDGAEAAATRPDPDVTFAAGTSMARLHEAGTVRIGVRFDLPGLGSRPAGAGAPTGLDVELATVVAARLGIGPDDITWVETVTRNREVFLRDGTVDLVVAAYPVTDARRKIVGQAGPYLVTGLQVLVRKGDPAVTGAKDLAGRRVCARTGSTALVTLAGEQYGARPLPLSSYDECVARLKAEQVDAVAADGALLLGLAAQDPDRLQVVGEPVTQERYGIGYPAGDTGLCEFLSDTIRTSFTDGTWTEAWARTLGRSGAPAPPAPTIDPCP